jgi:hypothetical protein
VVSIIPNTFPAIVTSKCKGEGESKVGGGNCPVRTQGEERDSTHFAAEAIESTTLSAKQCSLGAGRLDLFWKAWVLRIIFISCFIIIFLSSSLWFVV